MSIIQFVCLLLKYGDPLLCSYLSYSIIHVVDGHYIEWFKRKLQSLTIMFETLLVFKPGL